jgi:cyanophycinase
MNNEKLKAESFKGALIAHGGGNIDQDHVFKEVFFKLAGGANAKLVYIPSAFSDEQLQGNQQIHLSHNFVNSRFGIRDVSILHTRDREEADSESFVTPLMEADAVFITGGRQWRLADSYLNTRMHKELENLLYRGGVIAGSSAGATIQASFLVRGNSQPDDNKIFIGDHKEGFGFLKNIAIDQHLLEQNRQHDMLELIKIYPDILGIGIDVNTSILIQNSVMTVFGNSYVAVYDFHKLSEDIKHPRMNCLCLLRHGQRYNIVLRKVID